MQCIGGKKRLGCILDFLVEVFDSNICFFCIYRNLHLLIGHVSQNHLFRDQF